MHRFRNILVGVDLSRLDRLAASELAPPTQEAVQQALRAAARLGSPLTFLAVLDVSAQTQELLRERYEEASQSVFEQSHAVLDELVAEARAQGIEAERRVVFGRPWEEIIRQVLREGHDLVMVGTPNAGAASRWLFGSTATRLLRHCPCPVWVTKPDPNPEDVNMLIATDLSDTSQQALQLGIGCAQLLDARTHVVHAVEFAYEGPMLHTGVSEDELQQFRERIRDEARQTLHEQLTQTDYRTLAAGIQVHVLDGPADVVVLQAIEEHGIDLLVLGTVGRSGLTGLLLGNTAERLLSQIPCSVLAVKPSDFQSPVSL